MSNLQTADYITVAMSRFIQDGERVFHGVASPMPAIAIQLAKQLHAENAVYLSIAGGVDAKPSSYDLHSTAATQDRKSTRLNSSHVAMSYAVFCLKKKNNKYILPTHLY